MNNNDINTVAQHVSEEQLGVLRQSLMQEQEVINQKVENSSDSISDFAIKLRKDKKITESDLSTIQDHNRDIKMTNKDADTWIPEDAGSLTDSQYMDKEVPRHEKGRQESNVVNVQSQMDILDRVPNDSLSDLQKDHLDRLRQSFNNMLGEYTDYWQRRDQYHAIELEKSRISNEQGSLIDDYADPSLEQPSHMDPDD